LGRKSVVETQKNFKGGERIIGGLRMRGGEGEGKGKGESDVGIRGLGKDMSQRILKVEKKGKGGCAHSLHSRKGLKAIAVLNYNIH